MKRISSFVLLVLLQLLEFKNIGPKFDNDSKWGTDNLRQRFLLRKYQNNELDKKIKLFDKINSNKTLFFDGILHYFDDDLKNNIESAFRNFLAMTNVKYTFKRDIFWRTWRKVTDDKGKSTIVCYKCQSMRDVNCTKCSKGGYWAIEEKPPPCSFEIFKIKTESEVCAANFTNYLNYSNKCEVITTRNIKISCGNPIETKWRIMKKYNVSKRAGNVICQGRENCEITTFYTIHPDSIIFRIINSTNHVFYSKIMKSGYKNYICINDCGIYNPVTKEVAKTETPLTVDLFKNQKKKRENIHKTVDKNCSIRHQSIKLLENGLHYKKLNKKKKKEYFKDVKEIKNGVSRCKKIEDKFAEEYDNDSDYYNDIMY